VTETYSLESGHSGMLIVTHGYKICEREIILIIQSCNNLAIYLGRI
jgi:hypothetical protein